VSNSEPAPTTSPTIIESVELDRLSAEKLRLEIRALSKPWWRNPTNLGPVATISTAALALVWAMASGFFDVSRRELDVRRRELQNDLTILEDRRNIKNDEMERLKRRINEIDRPILTNAFVTAPTEDEVAITVRGFNLGEKRGKAYVVVQHEHLDCEFTVLSNSGRTPGKCFPVIITDSVTAKIVRWTTEDVELKVARWAVHASIERVLSTVGVAPDFTNYDLSANIERHDLKRSNPTQLQGWKR
jgi:hypothetical protein